MNKILSKKSNLMKYLDEWLKEVHADLCLNYFMPKEKLLSHIQRFRTK